MAYDPTQAEARDQIRGLIGDTDDPPILNGGEARYQAIATSAASVPAGALVALRELRRQLALRPVKKSAEGVSVDYTGRIAAIDEMIAELEAGEGADTEEGADFDWAELATDPFGRRSRIANQRLRGGVGR